MNVNILRHRILGWIEKMNLSLDIEIEGADKEQENIFKKIRMDVDRIAVKALTDLDIKEDQAMKPPTSRVESPAEILNASDIVPSLSGKGDSGKTDRV